MKLLATPTVCDASAAAASVVASVANRSMMVAPESEAGAPSIPAAAASALGELRNGLFLAASAWGSKGRQS